MSRKYPQTQHWFRRQGKGYQTRSNAALRLYMQSRFFHRKVRAPRKIN
jgi:hypothetical protein